MDRPTAQRWRSERCGASRTLTEKAEQLIFSGLADLASASYVRPPRHALSVLRGHILPAPCSPGKESNTYRWHNVDGLTGI